MTIILAIIYMIPSVIAIARRHHNAAAIVVLNVTLGWLMIPWIVALVWACTQTAQQKLVSDTRMLNAILKHSGQAVQPTARLTYMGPGDKPPIVARNVTKGAIVERPGHKPMVIHDRT